VIAVKDLERTLAELSADEMAAALGLFAEGTRLREATKSLLRCASAPLGRALARFDTGVAARGISAAAQTVLEELGVVWVARGVVPLAGPLLVVANHPGAYDALLLFAAMRRDDVAVVTAERGFLRALPSLEPHLLFVPEDETHRRARGLVRAVRHLRAGGALLHFGAGRIEPDPDFLGVAQPPLSAWLRGTGALARAAASSRGFALPATTRGVHSPRAKRALLNRFAERRGVSTVAPLLQVVLPRYRRVAALVSFGEPIDTAAITNLGDDGAITQALRAGALSLLG
jgi:1-acyl-sn-glycerol-3-phosphate acyltransferase